jgi:hypothetical protein
MLINLIQNYYITRYHLVEVLNLDGFFYAGFGLLNKCWLMFKEIMKLLDLD